MRQRALSILWPAFLMAGCLEAMVFAVIDPGDLRWFGGPPIEWSIWAIYTVTFGIFWFIIAASGAMTTLLALSEHEINQVDAGQDRSIDLQQPQADAAVPTSDR